MRSIRWPTSGRERNAGHCAEAAAHHLVAVAEHEAVTLRRSALLHRDEAAKARRVELITGHPHHAFARKAGDRFIANTIAERIEITMTKA
jgi:hypothetical protein